MNAFANISEIALLKRSEYEKACVEHTDHVFLGDDTVLCRILTKYKMYVDSKDLGIAPHLMMDGYWESWLTQFLARIIKPGFVCFDVGANFGYYSLLMSELCGYQGRTIAIEPNPSIVKLLRLSEFLHGWHFEIVEAALSDKKGEAILTINDRELGGGTIKPNELIPGRTQVRVPTVSVDELVSEKNINRVDVVKIDVEGVEPLVFAGMQKTIADNPDIRIIMEYTPCLYADASDFTDYLFSTFRVHQVRDADTIIELRNRDKPELLVIKGHTDLFLRRK